jgi:hypothetical protein
VAKTKDKKTKTKKEKDDKKLYAYYIELESPLDLARQVFDYSARHINAIKNSDNYMLMSYGEKFGDIRIIYCVKLKNIGNFFVYTPEADSGEKYEMVEKLPAQVDYKSYRAPIVEVLSNPYSEVKDFKKGGKVIKIEAKNPETFIKSMVGHVHDEEPMPKLYAFYGGKNHIVGTFEFFHEGGARIFTYAKIAIKEKFSTLCYNYIKDSIEPANSFVEKSVVYIRVINLKKPFPFF